VPRKQTWYRLTIVQLVGPDVSFEDNQYAGEVGLFLGDRANFSLYDTHDDDDENGAL